MVTTTQRRTKPFWPDEKEAVRSLSSQEQDRLDYHQHMVEKASAGEITLDELRRKTRGEWLFKLLRHRPECKDALMALCEQSLDEQGKVHTSSGTWLARDVASGKAGHEGRPLVERADGSIAVLWNGASLSEEHWRWCEERGYDSRYRSVPGAPSKESSKREYYKPKRRSHYDRDDDEDGILF